MIIKAKMAVYQSKITGGTFMLQIHMENYIPKDDEDTKFLGFTFMEVDTDALTQE